MRWSLVVLTLGLFACSGSAAPSRAKQDDCSLPAPKWREVAESPQARVFARGREFTVQMLACLRGSAEFDELGVPTDESLVRTRGRWVVYPQAGGEPPGEYYDLTLSDIKTDYFRRLALPGTGVENPLKALSLGATGACLYVQKFGTRERLVLWGNTRKRVLGRGPAGTFTRPRVKGLQASWLQDGRRRSVDYEVKKRRP